ASRHIRVCAQKTQELGMQILMTPSTDEDAVGGRPPSALTPIAQMVDLLAVLAARTTAAAVAMPHVVADRLNGLRPGGATGARQHDARDGFAQARVVRGGHAHNLVTAITRSGQTRTPGMHVAPLSARTTPPNLV